MVTQFKMKCKKCGANSDVTKYVVTPTYVFVAQSCGHRHFIDTEQLQKQLEELGIKHRLIEKEIELNLQRPRNYPVAEGKEVEA